MTKEKVYDFIKDFIDKKGYSPTLDEICQEVGIRSKATVSYNLAWLKAEGKLDWEFNKARTIRLIERDE